MQSLIGTFSTFYWYFVYRYWKCCPKRFHLPDIYSTKPWSRRTLVFVQKLISCFTGALLNRVAFLLCPYRGLTICPGIVMMAHGFFAWTAENIVHSTQLLQQACRAQKADFPLVHAVQRREAMLGIIFANVTYRGILLLSSSSSMIRTSGEYSDWCNFTKG